MKKLEIDREIEKKEDEESLLENRNTSISKREIKIKVEVNLRDVRKLLSSAMEVLETNCARTLSDKDTLDVVLKVLARSVHLYPLKRKKVRLYRMVEEVGRIIIEKNFLYACTEEMRNFRNVSNSKQQENVTVEQIKKIFKKVSKRRRIRQVTRRLEDWYRSLEESDVESPEDHIKYAWMVVNGEIALSPVMNSHMKYSLSLMIMSLNTLPLRFSEILAQTPRIDLFEESEEVPGVYNIELALEVFYRERNKIVKEEPLFKYRIELDSIEDQEKDLLISLYREWANVWTIEGKIHRDRLFILQNRKPSILRDLLYGRETDLKDSTEKTTKTDYQKEFTAEKRLAKYCFYTCNQKKYVAKQIEQAWEYIQMKSAEEDDYKREDSAEKRSALTVCLLAIVYYICLIGMTIKYVRTV